MATYFVPIENLDAPEAQRWFFHEIDADGPIDAMLVAAETFKAVTRNMVSGYPRRIVWAATRRLPTFAEMAELRRMFDACRYGGKQRRAA